MSVHKVGMYHLHYSNTEVYSVRIEELHEYHHSLISPKFSTVEYMLSGVGASLSRVADEGARDSCSTTSGTVRTRKFSGLEPKRRPTLT